MRFLIASSLSAALLISSLPEEALADFDAQVLTPDQRQAYEAGLDTCMKRRNSEPEIIAARKSIKDGVDSVSDVDFDNEDELWIFWEIRSPSNNKFFSDLGGICILTKDGRTLKRLMLRG